MYCIICPSAMKSKLFTVLATYAVFVGFSLSQDTFLPILNPLNLTRKDIPYQRPNITRRYDNASSTYHFKDYLMKFNPTVVFDRIKRRKAKMGKNASIEEDFDAIFEGIDITDDLLKIKVETGSSGRRKWVPPGKPNWEVRDKDVFSLRRRLYELITHTIYQTRNRMVIMQLLRAKYKNSSLYKMGYLMSRTDFACKDFYAFSYRVIHGCPNRYHKSYQRYEIISMMHGEERMVNKWFEIELFIDLINHNHRMAEEIIDKTLNGRKEKWKYVD